MAFIRAVHFTAFGTGMLQATGSGRDALYHAATVTRATHVTFHPYWMYSSNVDPMGTSTAAQAINFGTGTTTSDGTVVAAGPIQPISGSEWYPDAELISMIQTAQQAGLKVILKPMIDAYLTPTSALTAGSIGVLASGITTLNIVSAAAFATSGSVSIPTTAVGGAVLNYTGKTATTLTGCTFASGSGTTIAGNATDTNTWRANLDPGTGNAASFITAYKFFINHYATIAQQYGADIFIVGCELNSLVNKYTSLWTNAGGVVPGIKAIFTGKLSYAGYPSDSAWAAGTDTLAVAYTGLASSVDYLGWDWYGNLVANSGAGTTNVATLRANMAAAGNTVNPPTGYAGSWLTIMGNFSANNGNKPILFTETGFQNRSGSASNNTTLDGPAQAEQAAAVQAFIQEMEQGNHSWYGGVNFWGWWSFSNSSADLVSFRQYRRLADRILAAIWGSSSQATSATLITTTQPSTGFGDSSPMGGVAAHAAHHLALAERTNAQPVNPIAVNANRTAANGDRLFVTTGGGVTITLPDAVNDYRVSVKRLDNGNGLLSIVTPANTLSQSTGLPIGGGIDGALTRAISGQYTEETYVCDGSNWWVV